MIKINKLVLRQFLTNCHRFLRAGVRRKRTPTGQLRTTVLTTYPIP